MAKPVTVFPIADLEHNAASILRLVKESGEPAVITQEGHPEAVLLSIEIYQQVQAEREIFARLAQGEREIADGQGHDLDDVLNEAETLLLHTQD